MVLQCFVNLQDVKHHSLFRQLPLELVDKLSEISEKMFGLVLVTHFLALITKSLILLSNCLSYKHSHELTIILNFLLEAVTF